MKKFIALLAVAGLSGCVAYGVPYGGAGVQYGDGPYYGGAPYYSGSPYYGAAVVIEQRPGYIRGGTTYNRRGRDQDRDGVADRYDRDRDGDGVPNRRDAYPSDPTRR